MYEAKSFTMWVSYYDVAQELSTREQGEFYRAIMDYMFAGADREAELGKAPKICFKAIKANLKRSKANRRVVGDESGANRGEVHQPETALNLNLNSKLKKRSAGSGSDGGKPTPPAPCAKCGGKLEKTGVHRSRGKREEYLQVCGKCGEEVWA